MRGKGKKKKKCQEAAGILNQAEIPSGGRVVSKADYFFLFFFFHFSAVVNHGLEKDQGSLVEGIGG